MLPTAKRALVHPYFNDYAPSWMIQHGRSRRTYPQGPAVSHTFITWHKCICICLFLCHPCFVSPSLFDPRPMSSQYHSTFRTAQFQYTSHSTIACLICMYATFSINKLKRLNGHVPFSLSLSFSTIPLLARPTLSSWAEWPLLYFPSRLLPHTCDLRCTPTAPNSEV